MTSVTVSRDVELRDAPLLRPHEAEEVLEDLGQPVRLRDDDLHEPPLGGADRGAPWRGPGRSPRSRRGGCGSRGRCRPRARRRPRAARGTAPRRSSFFRSVRSWKSSSVAFLALGVLEQAERVAEHAPLAAAGDLDLVAVGLGAARARPDRSQSSAKRKPTSASRRPGARAGSTPRSSPPARFRNVTRCCASVVMRPEDIVAMTLP